MPLHPIDQPRTSTARNVGVCAPHAPVGKHREPARTTLLTGTKDTATDIALLRWVHALAQQESGRLVLQVQPKLVRLAQAIDRSITVTATLDGFADQRMSLLLLRKLMRSAVPDDHAAAYPYLNVPLPLVEQCMEAVNHHAKGRPAIGLFLGQSQVHEPGLDRIVDIAGIAWIKLRQPGAPGDLSIAWEDYLDQAALLECLDLVVTTDLVTVLLCGGLGKEVWWLGNPVWAKRQLSRLGALSPALKLTPLSGAADLASLENALKKWYNGFYDDILDRLPRT